MKKRIIFTPLDQPISTVTIEEVVQMAKEDGTPILVADSGNASPGLQPGRVGSLLAIGRRADRRQEPVSQPATLLPA